MAVTRPDPDWWGWEQVDSPSGEPFRLHTASGIWIRHLDRGQGSYWEVYQGPLDGAVFPSVAMAVSAVQNWFDKKGTAAK